MHQPFNLFLVKFLPRHHNTKDFTMFLLYFCEMINIERFDLDVSHNFFNVIKILVFIAGLSLGLKYYILYDLKKYPHYFLCDVLCFTSAIVLWVSILNNSSFKYKEMAWILFVISLYLKWICSSKNFVPNVIVMSGPAVIGTRYNNELLVFSYPSYYGGTVNEEMYKALIPLLSPQSRESEELTMDILQKYEGISKTNLNNLSVVQLHQMSDNIQTVITSVVDHILRSKKDGQVVVQNTEFNLAIYKTLHELMKSNSDAATPIRTRVNIVGCADNEPMAEIFKQVPQLPTFSDREELGPFPKGFDQNVYKPEMAVVNFEKWQRDRVKNPWTRKVFENLPNIQSIDSNNNNKNESSSGVLTKSSSDEWFNETGVFVIIGVAVLITLSIVGWIWYKKKKTYKEDSSSDSNTESELLLDSPTLENKKNPFSEKNGHSSRFGKTGSDDTTASSSDDDD